MHEAHINFPECSKCLHITQEGSITCTILDTSHHQMSETERREDQAGPHKASDMRQRAGSDGQRASMRHTTSSQSVAFFYRLHKRAAAHVQTMTQSLTRCLRQKEGKTIQEHTRQVT